MRRRLTAILVVFSLLIYGTAWAFAGHWAEAGGHEHVAAHSDPVPLDDDGACDHCCHAGAHLLALPLRDFAGPVPAADTFGLDAGFETLARAWDPPFKPPRC